MTRPYLPLLAPGSLCTPLGCTQTTPGPLCTPLRCAQTTPGFLCTPLGCTQTTLEIATLEITFDEVKARFVTLCWREEFGDWREAVITKTVTD